MLVYDDLNIVVYAIDSELWMLLSVIDGMCSDKQRIKCEKKNDKPFAQPCRY